ncbi:MAG: esterase family protein [Armatimonadetes bacterium]|nr:esterase family protein [Armatimonadota bacterium]
MNPMISAALFSIGLGLYVATALPEQPQFELGPDDKPAFPAAPRGFDAVRNDVPHGEVKTVEYQSKSVGTTRKMVVYTPPNYDVKKHYPVLYLLHGIGGTEEEWLYAGAVPAIMDNLYAENKAEPMIVVMPNGRAQKNDRAEGDVFRSAPAFSEFDKDLFGSIIPFIESHYSAKKDRQNRALAGLSMGGGQSLNFGLPHPEAFAWVGGFSSAPNTLPAAKLVPDPKKLKNMGLIWVSCGDRDGLFKISQTMHRYLKEKGVSHIWHVDSGEHNWPVWRNDLYLFTQRIFRK